MNYDDLVKDFAKRTLINLDYVQKQQQAGIPVYEVTQLVNSLLGLLVFPREHWINKIPMKPLVDLVDDGWPKLEILYQNPRSVECKDLKQLTRYLRNAISHCNVKFIPGNDNYIDGLELWNISRGKENWRIRLSIPDLEIIARKFIALLLSNEDEFHQAMLHIYHQEKEHCNYNATRFYQMLNEKGGLATAKALLASQEPQSGLTTLWECGRLDLSVEALVIDLGFEPLFSEEERETARERLAAYGYEVP